MAKIMYNRFPPGEFIVCADGKADRILWRDNLSACDDGWQEKTYDENKQAETSKFQYNLP